MTLSFRLDCESLKGSFDVSERGEERAGAAIADLVRRSDICLSKNCKFTIQNHFAKLVIVETN
jgi:hypothetical protein